MAHTVRFQVRSAQRTHDDVPLPSLGLVAGGNHHLAVRRCTNVASGLAVGRHTDRIRTVRIGTAHRVLHAVQQRVIIARYDATRSQKPEELTGLPGFVAGIYSLHGNNRGIVRMGVRGLGHDVLAVPERLPFIVPLGGGIHPPAYSRDDIPMRTVVGGDLHHGAAGNQRGNCSR